MRITKVLSFRAPFARALLLVCCACGGGSNVDRSDSTDETSSPSNQGNDIVADYLRRDAAPIRKQRVRFTITSEDEPNKIYEVDTWRRQTESETLTLTQIVKPAEDSDLASLTVEEKGGTAKVITFVASQNDFRETDTNKMFFGGLTAGELLGEWHKFNFRLLGEKEMNGARVYDLEGKIKKGGSGVVSRMQVLMRAAEPIPIELQLFDAGERQIRIYRIVDVKTDEHGAFAAKTEVENPIYNSKILVEILGREFPEKIDDAMFTREKLKEIATRKK